MMDRRIIAKQYRDSFGFNILPLIRNGKLPASGMKWRDIQGLDQRKLTDEEIDFWWGSKEITPEQIISWSKKREYQIGKDKIPKGHPRNNIGILLGKMSGVFVLDIDGTDAYDWIIKNGEPDTCYVNTSKHYKRHYYFQYPDFEVPSFNGRDNFNLDFEIKSDGVLTVLPPSNHPDGYTYTWIKSPFRNPINPANNYIINMVKTKIERDKKIQKSKPKQSNRKLDGNIKIIDEQVKMPDVLTYLGAKIISTSGGKNWAFCPFHQSKSPKSKPMTFTRDQAHCFYCQDQDSTAWNIWTILYRAGYNKKDAYKVLADIAGIKDGDNG